MSGTQEVESTRPTESSDSSSKWETPIGLAVVIIWILFGFFCTYIEKEYNNVDSYTAASAANERSAYRMVQQPR